MLKGWLDYLCLIWIAWGALMGMRAGLVRTVFGLLAFVASVAAAGWGSGPLVAWLDTRWGWTGYLSRWILERLPFPPGLLAMPVGGRVPFSWGEGLPVPLREALQRRAEILFREGARGSVGELLAGAVAGFLLQLAALLLLWLLAQRLVTALGQALAKWFEGRGLSAPDRAAGALVGAARQALLLSMALGVSLPFLALLGNRHLFPSGSLAATLAGWFAGAYPWLVSRLGGG